MCYPRCNLHQRSYWLHQSQKYVIKLVLGSNKLRRWWKFGVGVKLPVAIHPHVDWNRGTERIGTEVSASRMRSKIGLSTEIQKLMPANATE